MKIIHKNETKIFKATGACTAIEYPLGDIDINGSIIEIKGRYPDKGRTVNLKCKELAYVIEGSGRVGIEEKETKISQGSLILIEPGEKFFWEGDLIMFMPCTPAWYPDQHKEVE